MSYASRTGAFTSTNGLALGNGLNLAPNFGPTGLTLLVTGATLSQPVLTYSRNANGLFQLRLQVQPALKYRLEASTNLLDWISLLTTNSPSGSLDFTDPASAAMPHRFYRVLSP